MAAQVAIATRKNKALIVIVLSRSFMLADALDVPRNNSLNEG